MRMRDIKPGMWVVPSRNKRSRTRYWDYNTEYNGRVIGLANSFVWDIEWFSSAFPYAVPHRMYPVDIEPKRE